MSLRVNVYGGTADLASDIGTSPVGSTAHIPLYKLVWGDDYVSYKANETYPLPVQLMDVTGDALVVSGNLGASGSFPIINSMYGATLQYVAVAGDTSGSPIEITGCIDICSPVTITGERYLNSSTDSVTVTGIVGLSAGTLNLNSGTDSVSVYGFDGGPVVRAALFTADGMTIGTSGDALNVNLVNSGVTFSVNIGATVGVVNGDSGLVVQGLSGGTPIAVKGRNGEAIEVVNSPGSAVGVTGEFFTDGSQLTKVSEIVRPSSIVSGYTLASITATQLPSNALNTGVTIKAAKSNTDFIYVGNSGLSGGITTNGYPLQSGESIFIECNNTNLVYVIGTTGDVRGVHYIGS